MLRRRLIPGGPDTTCPEVVNLADHGPVLSIGRHSACEVRCDTSGSTLSAIVSRWHARLVKGPQGCSIEDTGSANGCYVNGVRVEKYGNRRLHDGDVISLGLPLIKQYSETTIAEAPNPFIFVYEETTPVFAEFLTGAALAVPGGTAESARAVTPGINTTDLSLSLAQPNISSEQPASDPLDIASEEGPNVAQGGPIEGPKTAEPQEALPEEHVTVLPAAPEVFRNQFLRGRCLESRARRSTLEFVDLTNDEPMPRRRRRRQVEEGEEIRPAKHARGDSPINFMEVAADLEVIELPSSDKAGDLEKDEKANEQANAPAGGLAASLLGEEMQCVICQGYLMSAHALSCSHTFCGDCISEWLAKKAVCPTCRKSVRNEKPTAVRNIDNLISRLAEQVMSAEDKAEFDQRMEAFKKKKAEEASNSGARPAGFQPQRPLHQGLFQALDSQLMEHLDALTQRARGARALGQQSMRHHQLAQERLQQAARTAQDRLELHRERAQRLAQMRGMRLQRQAADQLLPRGALPPRGGHPLGFPGAPRLVTPLIFDPHLTLPPLPLRARPVPQRGGTGTDRSRHYTVDVALDTQTLCATCGESIVPSSLRVCHTEEMLHDGPVYSIYNHFTCMLAKGALSIENVHGVSALNSEYRNRIWAALGPRATG